MFEKILYLLPSLVAVLTIFGCTPMTDDIVRDDPLIGKIVSIRTGSEISYQELLNETLTKDILYLGEQHQNAEHHRIQYRIISDMIEKGKRPRIGFEFFTVDQTGYLTEYVSGKNRGPHSQNDEVREKILRSNLGWDNRSDETWRFYFQFVELAEKHNLAIFGADLPNSIVRRITRGGLDSLNGVEKSMLRPTQFQDEHYRKLMYDKFTAAHCGFSNEKMLQRIYQTWLARNDRMAHSIVSMLEKPSEEPVILIVGKGHIEHNMGVYDRVAFLEPAADQLNLGLMEITRQPSELKDYIRFESVGDKIFPPLHEVFWFTQRSSYEDPCIKFKAQLEAMKKAHSDLDE